MPLNVWGGRGIIYRGKDGQVYTKPRKEYTRTHPYPAHINHIKRLPKEATAIIILRDRFRYSINHLATAFGRSTDFVYRILQNPRQYDPYYHKSDNRKSSRRGLLYTCKKKLKTLLFHMENWQDFILGLEDEPP